MNRDDIPGMVAEAALVASLLLDETAAQRLLDTGFDERMLVDPLHRAVYRHAVALQASGKESDVVAVWLSMREAGIEADMAALHALASQVASARAIRQHAETVIRAWRKREVIRVATEAHNIAMDGDTSAADAVDQIQSLFAGLQLAATDRQPRKLADVARDRLDRLQAAAEGRMEKPGWAIGIPHLDRLLGGFRPGHVYVLAARPSVGKSSFAEHIALRLALGGHPALFLSQEMPSEEVADRAMASIGRVDYKALQDANESGIDWSALATSVDGISAAPFWVDDEPALTLAKIRRKALGRKGLQVLVLDYLQLCSVPNKGNRTDEIGEISRGLKGLAKELGIAVIALSQLNRDVEKRTGGRPTLSDLRSSGDIEQDADCVMFLWRENNPAEDEPQLIGCGIEKNRQGMRGVLALQFDGKYQFWGESTESLAMPSKRQEPFYSRGLN